MNYEVKSKKYDDPQMKIKTSIWWARDKDSDLSVDFSKRILIITFIASVFAMVVQWAYSSNMKDYVKEYHTKVESSWVILDKTIDPNRDTNTYYLSLKNDKYKWVKEVDVQTYLSHKVGDTIRLKYTKSDLIGEDDVSGDIQTVMGITMLVCIILFTYLIYIVFNSGVFRIASFEYFESDVRTYNNNRSRLLFDNLKYIRDTYDKYVVLLRVINTVIIVGTAGVLVYFINQLLFYFGK